MLLTGRPRVYNAEPKPMSQLVAKDSELRGTYLEMVSRGGMARLHVKERENVQIAKSKKSWDESH